MAARSIPIILRRTRESVVVNFNPAIGVNPGLGSLAAHNGIVYGVTSQGGTGHQGVIYMLDEATGKQTVLHHFIEGPSGYEPNAGIVYQDGYLYGTTSFGGSDNEAICHYGCGTLFKFNLATKKLTILFGFTNDRSGGSPYADTLIYQDGALYGGHRFGRRQPTSRTAFKSPGAAPCINSSWTRINCRCSTALPGGRDGSFPIGSLVYLRGNLYGTTMDGGIEDHGTVYEVDAATGAETILHRFSAMGAKDGTKPLGGMTYYGGKLYGTTSGGGVLGGGCGTFGCGTIFELKP